MSDRPTATPEPRLPCHAHPLRDWVLLDLMLPTQAALLDRFLDRIEERARR